MVKDKEINPALAGKSGVKKKQKKQAAPAVAVKKKVLKSQEAVGMAAPREPGSRPTAVGLGTEGLAKPKPKKTPEVLMEKEEPESKVVDMEKPSKPAAQVDLGESSPRSLGEAGRPAGRDRYFEAVGRRKTSVARVRLFTKAGDFSVNDKPYGTYFPTLDLQKIVEDALQKMKLFGRFRVSVKVSGGGIHSQAEAVRHGLARCLVKFNQDFRKRLKRAGFLKRDPRMRERKKFGLKKARKAPQWAKR